MMVVSPPFRFGYFFIFSDGVVGSFSPARLFSIVFSLLAWNFEVKMVVQTISCHDSRELETNKDCMALVLFELNQFH